MQIIEATSFAVRSALYRLESDNGDPAVQLFPMIHIADPQFYEEITRRLEQCDVILREGVKSSTVSFLTLSYRFAGNSRLGLVEQDTMNISALKERFIHADIDGKTFDRAWSRLAFQTRFLVPMVAPIYGLYLRFFGTRKTIAQHLSLDVSRSRDEVLTTDEEDQFYAVALDLRDQQLVTCLEKELKERTGMNQTIGVLFGAAHMRAVAKHLLNERKYRVSVAEWVTVFDL